MSDAGDQGQGWTTPPAPPGGSTPPPPPGPTPGPPGTTPPAVPPPGATPPPPVPPGYVPAPAYAPQPPPAAPPAPTYPPAQPGYGAPPAYGAQPGYPPQPGYGYSSPFAQGPRTEPLAIAGLVCGIVAIPFCGLGVILGVLGLVFGILAMRRIDRAQGALTGRGMALAGAICGGVGLAINLLYWGVVIVAAVSDASS